jgi:hypothetical protein
LRAETSFAWPTTTASSTYQSTRSVSEPSIAIGSPSPIALTLLERLHTVCHYTDGPDKEEKGRLCHSSQG